MALETCFRAWSLHAPQAPLGCRDKLHLGNGSHGASKRAVVAPSSTAASPSSPVLSARRVGTMKSRFVCQAKNVVDEVVVADEKNWDNVVIASDMPVLVDFWAPWCGPCRMIDPVISELAKDYAGKIKCCKVNTDESPNIASNYGIRSIPTVLIFKDGEKKESIIGAVPKSTLCTIIDKYLEN